MASQLEFCPKCRVLRRMDVSESRRSETDEDAKVHQVLTRTYHCAACRAFVRSEDTEVPSAPPSA